MQTTENILVLLRCLTRGDKEILENEKGDYMPIAMKELDMAKGYAAKPIESRLQLELYGEYPLSPSSELDWIKNVKPSFKFNTY